MSQKQEYKTAEKAKSDLKRSGAKAREKSEPGVQEPSGKGIKTGEVFFDELGRLVLHPVEIMFDDDLRNENFVGAEHQFLQLLRLFSDGLFDPDNPKELSGGQLNQFLRIVSVYDKVFFLKGEYKGTLKDSVVPKVLKETIGIIRAYYDIVGAGFKTKYEWRPTASQYLSDTEDLRAVITPVFSLEASPQVLAERLREARKAKGWSQTELANAMGLKSKRAVQNLENARDGVTLSSIRSAMEALEIKEL
ncbi:hypothetical protein JANAI62_37750 [Jannaschia pagri]|uniref:HTH cro/C1-type domain-containing protein n=1 Tax=Jannaschia pagri TaxID=2829797 RepID=A0ABQ4NSP9_9RHOB|nr:MULTISPECIES: helix-turn-helix transcriptional regulator [unclassified Jannaschia]GIT93363.1 hypothetical protein JANAI61_38210 [Jannaschia sp. AI_61]GIT97152.1 hypothetical protein JANAI62_37750 [Jannaschia sp. AI_62]